MKLGNFYLMVSMPVVGVFDDEQELFDELTWRPYPFAEVTRLEDMAEANLLAFQKYGFQFFGYRQDGTARPMSLPVSGKYVLSPLATDAEKLPDENCPRVPCTQPADFGVWGIGSMNGFGTSATLSGMVTTLMSEAFLYPVARWCPDYNAAIAWAQTSYCFRFYSRFLGTEVAPRIPTPAQLPLGKMYIDNNYSAREGNRQENTLLQKFLSLGLIG